MLVGQYQQNAAELVGGRVGRGLYGRGEGCNQWRIAWDSYAREGLLTAKPDGVRISRWGYIHSYGSNDERLDPPGLLSRYDYRRPHGGIGGATQPPASVQCFWELYLDGIGE